MAASFSFSQVVLSADVKPPVFASKSGTGLTVITVATIRICAIVSVGTFTKWCSRDCASRSDRASYDAGGGIGRPKSSPTIVALRADHFGPILCRNCRARPASLGQRRNNRRNRQYCNRGQCLKTHLIFSIRRDGWKTNGK
jgi:hypothetical protein